MLLVITDDILMFKVWTWTYLISFNIIFTTGTTTTYYYCHLIHPTIGLMKDRDSIEGRIEGVMSMTFKANDDA